MSKTHKILIVATSRKTRGGITAVVNTHMKGEQWEKYHCKWIESHIDRGGTQKIFYFVKSAFQFLFIIPFYDLVHIHVATYSSLIRKSYFFFIAKLFRKKIIIHFHSSTPDVIFEESNKKMYRYIFSKSDLVLVLSDQWKEWVYEALGVRNNVSVLHNSVPSPVLENKDIQQRDKSILFAGTIIDRKGYRDLIKAFAIVAPANKDWTLIFAGNGEIEKGIELASSLNISEQVVFKGWVSGNEKDHLFRTSSIFCLSSYSEGFPMAVLDAWAYHLPVICTPVGGLPDIVENKVNALVYPAGDIQKLAEAIDLLIKDEALRRQISNESYKLSKTIFNLDAINKQLGSIYEELLGYR